MTTVWITPNGMARSKHRVYHTDEECPRLHESRAVDRDSLDDRFSECRQCAGLAEQPETHTRSLRSILSEREE